MVLSPHQHPFQLNRVGERLGPEGNRAEQPMDGAFSDRPREQRVGVEGTLGEVRGKEGVRDEGGATHRRCQSSQRWAFRSKPPCSLDPSWPVLPSLLPEPSPSPFPHVTYRAGSLKQTGKWGMTCKLRRSAREASRPLRCFRNRARCLQRSPTTLGSFSCSFFLGVCFGWME